MALACWRCTDSAVAEVNLTVEAIAGYTDNLLRVPDGDDDVPVSLGLTGTWTENTRHLSADVEGRVDGITYLNDTYDDGGPGPARWLGDLVGGAGAVRLVLDNVYGQITTDPFSPIGPDEPAEHELPVDGPGLVHPAGRADASLSGRPVWVGAV